MISLKNFCEMCPTHILLDKDMNIVHCGSMLLYELDVPLQNSINLLSIFNLQEPKYDKLSFAYILKNLNVFYIFACKSNLKRCNNASYNKLILKGPMIPVNKCQNFLYLGSPYVHSAKDLKHSKLYMEDMPLYDVTRPLIMLSQSNSCLVYENEKLKDAAAKARKLNSKLSFQKERNLNLINEFLPPSIVNKKLHENLDVSDYFPLATCMIANIAFFDVILCNCKAKEVFQLVTDLFKVFDHLVDLHGCYKVASMMESYFVIANVPEKQDDQAEKILNLAIGFLMEAKKIVVPDINLPIMLNIAIHTGPVMAGLVGQTIMRYSIIGEGFDVAKYLIKIGETPGKILLTGTTKQLVFKSTAKNAYEFTNNGYRQVRKNVATCTFTLEKNKKKSVWDIIETQPDEGCTKDGYTELHENKLSEWVALEKNIRCQQTVIALMKNKPFPINSGALRRLRWSKQTKITEMSADSGISMGSMNSTTDENNQNNSKICTVM